MEAYEPEKVLIVDDKQDNLILLKKILEKIPNIHLIEAKSGAEAVSKSKGNQLALIIMDVQMPGMDGFSAAEIIRQTPETQEVPIIFVTAIIRDQKQIFKGYEIGAVDYLFKPLDPLVLKSKVKVFLDLHRSKLELEAKNKELENHRDRLDNLVKARTQQLRLSQRK